MITFKYNNLETTEGNKLIPEIMLSSPSVSQTKDDNMNNNNNNMITRRWTKQNVQQVLRQLRGFKTPKGESLFKVTKKDSSYEVNAVKNGELVLSAMNGRFDYLVRCDSRLFNAMGSN